MKSITLGESGNKCGHCSEKLYWKAHKEITEKERRRAFYFSRWEYCPSCKTTWLHPEFKVTSKNTAVKEKLEYAQQLSFLRNL
jgi:hypothetical protein